MTTIQINGVTYEIVRTRDFQHNGQTRTALFLRRHNGSRIYHAVRYETGKISEAV